MITIEKAETDILALVTKWSWLLLVIMTASCSIFGSTSFGLGVAAGGIIALGNNFWLRSTLERILIQQRSDIVIDDFEVLGLGLAAVDGGRHAASRTKFLNTAAIHKGTRERFQWN